MGLDEHLGGPALPEIVGVAGPEATLKALLKSVKTKLDYSNDGKEQLQVLYNDLLNLIRKWWDV